MEKDKKPIYKKIKHSKEFSLSSWSVNNKMTVYVITAIIFISGLTSYLTVPREAFPEIVIPEIIISTVYPGNSPEDMEKLITRPLEKELNGITGIDEITSTSVQGFSMIDIKFDFDVTPTEALRKVKDKIDVAMSDSDFPDDLPADPSVIEMNFSEMIPIMNINLSGDFSLETLEEYAEILEERIENMSEISKVDIKGVMDKEVSIELDFMALEARELGFNDVAMAIGQENMTISGGDLMVDQYKRSVRVVGDFSSIEEMGDVVIKNERQNVVYLRDVADISFVEKEKESYAREYLSPVVSLDVIKRASENLISASEQINEIIAAAKRNEFPENLSITITNDQSNDTKTQVAELENSIIFGIILVVGVLLFFLGFRNAVFVGIAIPMSFFLSFIILNAMGVTLNTMVLFSLVLALGMLVDNGIVVVENIYRYMDDGYSPSVAAKNGVGEVAWPIIASTATTLAAFLPLAIWPGMMGEFMKYLPITLIIVLTSSLFVALIINPVLTAVFMKVKEKAPNKKKTIIIGLGFIIIGFLLVLANEILFGNMLMFTGFFILLNTFVLTPMTRVFQDKILPWMESGYEKFLGGVLKGKRPIGIFGLSFLLLITAFLSLAIFPPKTLFFPVNEPRYLNVFIEKEVGTDIETTDKISQDIEGKLMDLFESDEFKRENESGESDTFLVTSIIGQSGNGTSDPMQGPSIGNTPHKARVTISFVKSSERRGINTSEVMNRVREELKDFPDAEIVVGKDEGGPPQGPPINIEISGDNYDSLMVYAEAMKLYINQKNIGGVEELKLDVNKQKPEMPIYIDRAKARRYGLSTGQVGDAIRTALFGKEISTYKEGEDDYPINIRFKDEYRNSQSAILDQKITFRDQTNGQIKQVPISAVATASSTRSFSAVKRKDLDRVITISSNVLEGYNPNEIVTSIKRELQDFEMGEDIAWDFTGQQEEQAEEMEFLMTALMIAVFLIFLIIVAQFNSTSTPVIIMFAVVFSLIGVLFGLQIFNMDFIVIMTMIGIISLAGVVVNNAIVLIDYTNLLRDRRMKELDLEEDEHLPFSEVIKVVVQGGKTRLRPVLLTAITTILGLFPLAIGLNIDFVSLFTTYDPRIYIGGDNVIFWGPMSWTIIFGLSFATFLTLVVVPAMYLILIRFKYRTIFKSKELLEQ